MPADVPGLVHFIASAMAENPDAVRVSTSGEGNTRTVHLQLAEEDMGRVIGREGRVANAIRTLIDCAQDEVRWRLEIED